MDSILRIGESDTIAGVNQKVEQLSRDIAEVKKIAKRNWVAPVCTSVATVACALAGGWFALQESRAIVRAQSSEASRQVLTGEVLEKSIERGATKALATYESVREQQTKRVVRELLAQAPLRASGEALQ